MSKASNLFLGILLTLLGVHLPRISVAEDVLAREQRAIARINIAARQRYLVQSVAKSGCFALTKHRPQQSASEAWLRIIDFDASFQTLLEGNPELDVLPEKNADVIAAIASTELNWFTFRAATQQIISGDWHSVPMRQLIDLNGTVLSEVNAAVDQLIETHSSDLYTQKAYAATVNVAGRQRMLVQKAAKEMCFISLGIAEDAMRASLAETVDLFGVSLDALENGNFDMSVIDPPSLAVLSKISEVRVLWDMYRDPLEAAAHGAAPPFEDVAFIEETSGQLYALSDELVSLYVNR